MRIASWLFVACAVLSAVGLVMPSLELRVRGVALGRRTSLSLYQAHEDHQLVRRVLAAYRSSSHRRDLEAITEAKLPKLPGHAQAHLDDAHDALTSLDDVSDRDVRTADLALTITIWAFLVLQIATAGFVFVGNVRGVHRRGHLIAALALAIVTAAVAIAIHLALREVAWEANDDLGVGALALAPGAFVIPIAACGTVACGIALLALRRVSARRPE